MEDPWSAILRCPYCHGRFRFDEMQRPAECNAEFGILRCNCGAFPVVDGIPIVLRPRVSMFAHTTGATRVHGVAVAHVVRLIEGGRPLEALVECLAIPMLPPLARRWLPARVVDSHAGYRVARWRGKRKLRRQVLARRRAISAQALLDFYYQLGQPLGRAIGDYFILRFAQPRHLAALALLAALPGGEKPVLDIACGLGHFEHYLSERTDPAAAIGIDMNYFQLWIARHWIATRSRFVCAKAQDGLPFSSDAFSATLCSDAYHLLPGRPELRQEIERCAPGRPVLLTGVGNRAVMPNEGLELTVQEYLDEFGAVDVRSFSETDLVRAYLRRSNPFVPPARSPLELNETKWLSFAWNVPPTVRDPLWGKDAWPHAVGQINVNLIYRSTRTKEGDLHLRFTFPSVWFAYENHGMLSYHPQQATISRAQLQRLAAWRDDPSLAALVESFVLIGLPTRFKA
jgi:SAM-dependent methyltransferase/uncharacterized protein YbaR (Trm112 family)